MIKKISLIVIALICASELILRLMGLADFPLYDADSKIGYIPRANQSGAFMKTNDWLFNDEHMGGPAFKPSAVRDILLIGDSLVYGGNKYRQNEKLGPSLQRALGSQSAVWPVGAGSWSINNELTWLRQHPEVVREVDEIVFVLNSGDLVDESSAWRCESTHPRKHPWSILIYQIRKHLKLEDCADIPSDFKVPSRPWKSTLLEWLNDPIVRQKKVHFVLYPDKPELTAAHTPTTPQLARNMQTVGKYSVINVGGHPDWGPDLYEDGIHPTAKGNEVLGRIIAERL